MSEQDPSVQPVLPEAVVEPTQPTEPTAPTEPTEPTQPAEPTQPTEPTRSTGRVHAYVCALKPFPTASPSSFALIAEDEARAREEVRMLMSPTAPEAFPDHLILVEEVIPGTVFSIDPRLQAAKLDEMANQYGALGNPA